MPVIGPPMNYFKQNATEACSHLYLGFFFVLFLKKIILGHSFDWNQVLWPEKSFLATKTVGGCGIKIRMVRTQERT